MQSAAGASAGSRAASASDREAAHPDGAMEADVARLDSSLAAGESCVYLYICITAAAG